MINQDTEKVNILDKNIGILHANDAYHEKKSEEG